MDKISISRKDLESFVENFWQKCCEAKTGQVIRNMEVAFEEFVFNVEEEFNPDDWNSCTIKPPKKYNGCDVILRENTLSKRIEGCTSFIGGYKLAYIDVNYDNMFRFGEEAVIKYDAFKSYEYKLIK